MTDGATLGNGGPIEAGWQVDDVKVGGMLLSDGTLAGWGTEAPPISGYTLQLVSIGAKARQAGHAGPGTAEERRPTRSTSKFLFRFRSAGIRRDGGDARHVRRADASRSLGTRRTRSRSTASFSPAADPDRTREGRGRRASVAPVFATRLDLQDRAAAARADRADGHRRAAPEPEPKRAVKEPLRRATSRCSLQVGPCGSPSGRRGSRDDEAAALHDDGVDRAAAPTSHASAALPNAGNASTSTSMKTAAAAARISSSYAHLARTACGCAHP